MKYPFVDYGVTLTKTGAKWTMNKETMDKETEKQAFDQWLGWDSDDPDRKSTEFKFARQSWLAACKWMEARGRASGQQGVEGYRLVPVEPTLDYLREVARNCADLSGTEYVEDVVRIVIRAIAASPQITTPAAQPEGWDFVSKRVAKACDEALRPKGMSTHSGKVTLEISDVQRLLAAAEPPGGT